MIKNAGLILLFLLVFCLSIFADAASDIEGRIKKQFDRINQGVKSGELKQSEIGKLMFMVEEVKKTKRRIYFNNCKVKRSAEFRF